MRLQKDANHSTGGKHPLSETRRALYSTAVCGPHDAVMHTSPGVTGRAESCRTSDVGKGTHCHRHDRASSLTSTHFIVSHCL